MEKTAVIAGITGIVGSNLATHLLDKGWNVVGLARDPSKAPAGVRGVSANLLDRASVREALHGIRPTHAFFATWSRQPTEKENIEINGKMLRNFLTELGKAGTLEHTGLVTGLKHYLGPFEMYANGTPLETPFRETMPRLNVENFYYVQEDELSVASQEYGFGWTVHRPHTMIGHAIGNAMNIGVTLAAYASLCKDTKQPFVFPGSHAQWNGVTDMADARLVAEHLEWAATTPSARNQALNVVNGDVFRWNWMWGRIADWFGIEAAEKSTDTMSLEPRMAAAGPAWREIAQRHGLVEPHLDRLASAWHTDADLGRPFECLTDMSKSRELGFTSYRRTDQSFFDLFERLRQERYIP